MPGFTENAKWQFLVLPLLFCLLTILGARVSVPIWEIPFTLQTLAVYSSGLFLRWKPAIFSQFLYLLMGLFWPVFAGDGHGVDYLFSRLSSGYLLSFPLVAALVSVLSHRWGWGWQKWLSLQAGSILLFLCGTIWLSVKLGIGSLSGAAHIGWFKYIPADQLKIAASLAIYYAVQSSFRNPTSSGQSND